MAKTHRKHVFHLRRVGLLGVLLVAFFIVRFDTGNTPTVFARSHVLSYATEMSREALFSATNAARAANGLASLALNGKLNSSAQAKAQDMANKDYWAHVAPDGTQPWYFFDQAGYSYIRAGENLAYGFTSSQEAVNGWMNSAGHRANVLGDYYDVGFGIVNAPSYQANGEQTIVVAHYGATAAAPVAAPAAPAAPAPSQTLPTQSTPAPTPAPTPVAEPTPTPVTTPTVPNPDTTPEPETVPVTKDAPTPVIVAGESRVSVLSMIASRSLPLTALLSLVMVSITVVGYALTHRVAFQHAVSNGEHFVVAHPGLDSGIVAAVTTLIMMTTYGHLG